MAQLPDEAFNTTYTARELIAAVLREIRPSLSTPINETPTTTTMTTMVASRALNWSDIPPYPGRCDRLDAWFCLLEGKFISAKIPEDLWPEKIAECPKIGEQMKKKLAAMHNHEDITYKDIRKYFLKLDGPLDPTGYFRNQIFHVKGTNGEDVMKQLQDALVLLNRAAVDEGVEQWKDRDLVTAFVGAFPEEISVELKKNMRMVLAMEDPLNELVIRAPEKGRNDIEDIPLVAAIDRTTVTKNNYCKSNKENKNNTEDPLIAAINGMRNDLNNQMSSLARTVTNPPRRVTPYPGNCRGCGGRCPDRTRCPASGKTCNFCGGLHHFASQCWKKRAGAGNGPIRRYNGVRNINNKRDFRQGQGPNSYQ